MNRRREFLSLFAKLALIAALSLTSVAAIGDDPPHFGSGFCLVCSCNQQFDPGCGGICAIATFTGCGPGGNYSCDGC